MTATLNPRPFESRVQHIIVNHCGVYIRQRENPHTRSHRPFSATIPPTASLRSFSAFFSMRGCASLCKKAGRRAEKTRRKSAFELQHVEPYVARHVAPRATCLHVWPKCFHTSNTFAAIKCAYSARRTSPWRPCFDVTIAEFSLYRAMLCIRGTSHGPVSVCVCVRPCLCLSQVGVLLKRQNVGSHKQHHTIAQGV